jgi:hypothetical protein
VKNLYLKNFHATQPSLILLAASSRKMQFIVLPPKNESFELLVVQYTFSWTAAEASDT